MRCLLVCILFILLASPMPAQYTETAVSDGGTITGTVRVGVVPDLEKLVISKDNVHCGNSKASPRLSVGKSGGVSNAIIGLADVKRGKAMNKDVKPILSQRRCEYAPHVMIVPFGCALEIANDDPILHNVHAYESGESPRSIFNIAQPMQGQRTTIKATYFKKPGLVVTTCDAGHPWMSNYIMVAPHPYYAVTDSSGKFTLTDIPPGTYTLTMWHEGVWTEKIEKEGEKPVKYYYEPPYEMSQPVTVAPRQKLETEFELVLRSPGASK